MIRPTTEIRPGRLLVAPPLQWDPNFSESVVLVCEHSDTGSFGLILNRTLTLAVEQLFDDLGDFEDDLSWGGPVQPDTLHFLHRIPDQIPGSIPLSEGLCWGGDFDEVRRQMRLGLIDQGDIRFFIGYTGWSPGQLQLEFDAGGWLLQNAEVDAIFDLDEQSFWRNSLRRQGGGFEIIADVPGFSLN